MNRNYPKIFKSLLLLVVTVAFLGSANAQSRPSFDPEIEKYIAAYQKYVEQGNVREAQNYKEEIIEMTRQAYPSRLKEIKQFLGGPTQDAARSGNVAASASSSAQPNHTSKGQGAAVENMITSANEKKGIITYMLNGEKACARKATDDKFNGLYKYPGTEARFWKYVEGEPIVELSKDQKGRFQRHGVPPLNVTWWLSCDCNGILESISGPGGTRYYLVIRYEEAGEYNNLLGTYQKMTLDVLNGSNKMIILGEREKN